MGTKIVQPPQFGVGDEILTNIPQVDEVPFRVQVEQTIGRMRAPLPTQPISGRRTITPTILVQIGTATALPLTVGTIQLPLVGPSLVMVGPSTSTNPDGPKVG